MRRFLYCNKKNLNSQQYKRNNISTHLKKKKKIPKLFY